MILNVDHIATPGFVARHFHAMQFFTGKQISDLEPQKIVDVDIRQRLFPILSERPNRLAEWTHLLDYGVVDGLRYPQEIRTHSRQISFLTVPTKGGMLSIG